MCTDSFRPLNSSTAQQFGKLKKSHIKDYGSLLNQKERLIYTDNCMLIARGKRFGEVKEGKGSINGDGRTLELR